MRPSVPILLALMLSGLFTTPVTLLAQTDPPKTAQPPPNKAEIDELDRLYDEGEKAYDRGDMPGALKAWQTGLEKAQAIKDERWSATFLNNIGNVYFDLGQNEKALDFYQRALTLKEKIGNPQEIAGSLNNIGAVYYSLGQNEKALDFLQRAFILKEKIGNQQDIASSLGNIGSVYKSLNQYEKAENFYLKALGLFEKFSRDVLADPTQLGDLLTTTSLYENYALLLTDYKRPEDALNLLERKRAQALALQLGVNQNSLTRLFTTEENSKLKTLRQDAIVQAKNFAAITSRPAPPDITRYREAEQKKQEAVNRYELFRDTLYNKHPQFRLVQGERARSIKEFHRLSTNNPDTFYLEYATASDRSLLVMALHNGVLTVKKYPIGKKHIETLVRKWREAMENREAEEKRLAQELYALVLQPLQSLLDSPKVKRLVVVADGALLDVPFSALMDKSGRRLIERFAVSNALSLGILLWPENPELSTKGLLCVADTRGETPRTQVVSLTRGGGFGPLPSARKEGENVASLYPKNSTLLIGGQASEAVVKKEMGKYAILHFAAHGDLDTKNGLRSALVLASEPAGSENDGFLDGREIIELGVTAKLAVLSACQSGQGKKSGGEGLMGLAWAFRAGGCPSVIASQWKVDDAATKDLMLAFYRGLKAGKRKDDALRDAMLSMKKARFQPYYWAAFQVIGETNALQLK